MPCRSIAETVAAHDGTQAHEPGSPLFISAADWGQGQVRASFP